MNVHDPETIALYAAGQLAADEAAAVASHMADCPNCQTELAFWRELGSEINTSSAVITAPPDLAERALSQINAPSPLKHALNHTAALLRSQFILIRREMWAASAAFMALVIIMAFLSRQTGFLTALAPMLAAATLAAIYGPQNDPASELALATPTSPWKVLLARMSIVSAYNLVLSLAASLALLLIIPADLLGSIILAWLGPLAFLSALALLLSLWIGTANAITICYAAWLMQYFQPSRFVGVWTPTLQTWENFLTAYKQFWASPGLLLGLTVVAVCLALLSSSIPERSLQHRA
jgi:Putative zinc-finger